jgi:hypothetical protein
MAGFKGMRGIRPADGQHRIAVHAVAPTSTSTVLNTSLHLTPPSSLLPPLPYTHMQADWAFAVRQVEESASCSTTLPELRLVDATGRVCAARDVTLWRVDSLEDTPIGFAVLFKSWSYV